MQLQLAAESHVPCFQERVGTKHPGYMILDRLPWLLRARPSATLHEILSAFGMTFRRTCPNEGTKMGSARQVGSWGALGSTAVQRDVISRMQ